MDKTKMDYDGSDIFVEEITSSEVLDMLEGDDYMNFVVEMPIAEFERFIKS